MQAFERFILNQQTLWLSADRCIYWEEQKSLIISDLHFGKTGHFRKSGIAVPQSVYKEDMQRLVNQLQLYKPQQLIVVGDLFHSVVNKELDFFKKWRNDFSHLHIQLVKGNHDILKNEWYSEANISVSDNHLHVANFCFVHDISDACTPSPQINYYFSGHIHPCVLLKGLAKQSLSLPCYYFTDSFAVLPAFSKFTGGASIEPKSSDNVFAIIPANPLKSQNAAVIKI
ncbi:ligase-associated DNA damage response endonuclease PdeM [Segetibacter koreensis]|uniref:ligase-associated DNA damage response endonuclease PdeM n=1 Tax=Segetibacter koreensis TaxID=398037 RepID=UPI0003682BA1|nr:ligase-associated DNA damage response endonuclease PdeM [Segetibacter koreensis]